MMEEISRWPSHDLDTIYELLDRELEYGRQAWISRSRTAILCSLMVKHQVKWQCFAVSSVLAFIFRLVLINR